MTRNAAGWTAERARWVVLLIYIVCLAASIALLFGKQFTTSDYPIVDSVVNVVALYAVPLSIIVTAVSSRRTPDPDVSGTTLVLLFGSTILWNALVVGTLAYYYWASVTATRTTMHFPNPIAQSFLSSVPEKLTFLISGALTYFFVGSDKPPTPAVAGAGPTAGGTAPPVAATGTASGGSGLVTP